MNDLNQFIPEALKQVPSLAVLAFIVFVFLKHLKSYNQMIREINKENIEAREQSRVVIEENTKAVAKNTEVLHQITAEMLYSKIKKQNS